MDMLMRNLLLLGYEDYTGLWAALEETRHAFNLGSREEARVVARGIMKSLLNDELIELFSCYVVPNPDTVEALTSQEAFVRLERNEPWLPPEEDEEYVLFATTDKGWAAHQEAVGRKRQL